MERRKYTRLDSTRRYLYGQHLGNCKLRNRIPLAYDEWMLFEGLACYACGVSALSRTPLTEGDTIYRHGLDRVDNKLGYDSPGNTKPCCKQCNYEKGDYDFDQHLESCKRKTEFNDPLNNYLEALVGCYK
jgi:hypothetical protein